MNLKEIAYAHYLPAKRKRRRANTCEGYASALRLHVIPRFGAMEMEAITHEAIQEWVDGFELPGAAAKAFKTLRQVIRWSIANLGIRIWDPTIGIELPRKPKAEKHVLTAEEVATTLRGFWGHELEPAVILSSVLGLRPGETYGMKWSDIDMRSGAVHVRRTLQEVRGLLHVYLPKTEKSERTVYLPRFALDRLRTVWREQGRPKGRVIGAIKPSVMPDWSVATFDSESWDTEYHRLIRPTTPLAFLLLRMLPFSTSCMATLTYFSTSPLSKNLTDTYRGLLPSTAQPLDPNRNLSPTRHGISISLSSLSPAAADAYTPTISQSAIPCTVLDSPLLI